MLWSTLLNRLKKKPMKNLKYDHVCAVLRNPKTDNYETVFLTMKFDAKGSPYLVKDDKTH